MTNTLEATATVLFDDKSAVEAFIKKGWLEKISNGQGPDETLCRYTDLGLVYKKVIRRFEAN